MGDTEHMLICSYSMCIELQQGVTMRGLLLCSDALYSVRCLG